MATTKPRTEPKSNMVVQRCQVDDGDSSSRLADVSAPRNMPEAAAVSPLDKSSQSHSGSRYELASHGNTQGRRRASRNKKPYCSDRTMPRMDVPINRVDVQHPKGADSAYTVSKPQSGTSLKTSDHRHGRKRLADPLWGVGGQFGESRADGHHDDELQDKDDHHQCPAACSATETSRTDSVSQQDQRSHTLAQWLCESLGSSKFKSLLEEIAASLDARSAEHLGEYDDDVSDLDPGEDVDYDSHKRIETRIWQVVMPIMRKAWTYHSTGHTSMPVRTVPGDTCSTNAETGAVGGGGATSLESPRGTKTSQGKKTRDNANDDQGRDGGKESGGGGSGPDMTAVATDAEHHELACPYNLYDPNRFCRGSEHGSKYQSCTGSFRDTAAIIQHFRERHYYNDKVCLRCQKQLPTKVALRRHLRSEPICPVVDSTSIENELPLLPESGRRQRLERLDKRRVGISNEAQWCRIWNALFPGKVPPSPYRRQNSLEKDFDRAVNTFIPTLVYDIVHNSPQLSMEVVETHCRRTVDAIRDRIWPYFEVRPGCPGVLEDAAALPPLGTTEDGMPPASLTDGSTLPTTLFDNLASDYSGALATSSGFDTQTEQPGGISGLGGVCDGDVVSELFNPPGDVGHRWSTDDESYWLANSGAFGQQSCANLLAETLCLAADCADSSNGTELDLPEEG